MRLVLLAPLVLLATACGSAHHSAEPSGAKLLVGQTVNPGGGIPIEGAFSYVRIEDRSGSKVAERRVQSDRNVEIPLDPGSYRLVSYQRTCDGNCGTLDPASDSCSESFTADGTVTARVRVTYGAGCTITFASEGG